MANVLMTTRRSNMQAGRRGKLDIGGTLTLTDDELRFEPNASNLGLGRGFVLSLGAIREVRPVRAYLYGLLPSPWNNGMWISGDGEDYVVRVWHRDAWLDAISNARSKADAGGD